jgi:hypothetical protein
LLFGPHDLLYICSAKHQFRQLALHPAPRCHGPVCMRVKLILLPPGTVLPACITLSYQFIPIANDSCNQTSISNIQESISPKKKESQFARHLISDTMFDFSSMGVECDKAAMAPGLGSDLLHEPGLGSELRTGTRASTKVARPRAHARKAAARSVRPTLACACG